LPYVELSHSISQWIDFTLTFASSPQIPLTIVIRLYLLSLDHPMPRFLADIVVGDFSQLDPEAEVKI